MKINYFFENRIYLKNEIFNKLSLEEINYLLVQNIIKIKNNNYFFTYVGLITFNNNLFIILPKYLSNNCDKKLEAKKLFSILDRYFDSNINENYLSSFVNDNLDNSFQIYSLYKFILEDFLEYGIYSNYTNSSELNGNSSIDWNKTISEISPIFTKGNKPYYLDFVTTTITLNDRDYIKLLHQFYLNKSSIFLENLNFLGFDYPKLNFNIDIIDIGEKEYQLYKINKELENVYSDRKIILLKVLKALIEMDCLNTNKEISLYGTNTFYDVWEKACGFILGNQYDSLKKYIAKPYWSFPNDISFKKETLIPDILVNTPNIFYIFDAKYYLPKIHKKEGFPGIESITKQYLYELAFKDVDKFKDKIRKNFFLIPSLKEEISIYGLVELEFLKNIGLQDILVLEFPVNLVFNLYCKNKLLDFSLIERYIL